ncbi:MAG: hypothetical protein ACC635_05690 [Acidiferrobacterales bacterium]
MAEKYNVNQQGTILIKITMSLFPKFIVINARLLGVIFVLSLSISNSAHAWVYSEHRDIAIQAVQNLDAEYRADFDRLWASSRTGSEKQLCENAAYSEQGQEADCLDWAAFSAIAGDHSCSSKELLSSILTENWLLKIADVSAQLKSRLAAVPVEALDAKDRKLSVNPETILEQIQKQENRAKRSNALRTADANLLSADPQYATRASSNAAHFLIARPAANTTGLEYAELALSPGSEINAVGVYVWYHIKALQKASRLANETQLTIKQRQEITRSMLADEGFALHFLEDIFSAGHVAGTWGEVTQRLGTHNYYNQHGLEVYTWKRKEYPVVLMGDAHMRQRDVEFAAKTISSSLKQVIDFAIGRDTGYDQPFSQFASTEPDNFNVCTQNQFSKLKDGHKYRIPIEKVIAQTPIPGLGSGLGALPRFRSEVGPFVGLSGTIDARIIDGGFLASQDTYGSIAGLDLSFRAGFGMDGIMNESGDGLIFASIGFRSDSASSNQFSDTSEAKQAGSIGAAIPARSGITSRIRMPFYFLPTDLIWLAPLYFFNESAYTNIAVTAVNGGLIPWQRGMATSIGRFQFVLGRELGATFYGWNNSDQIIVPADSTGPLRLYKIRSILYDFPILEYRPYRSFSTNQSSSIIIQLFTSADIPQERSPVIIDGESQTLDTVWSIGLRLAFDWRHY